MIGRIHMLSWGLLVGAVGQSLLWGGIFPRAPRWMVFAALLPPWLTVYTISFCRQAPFGPRPFRYCLLFAMCWYALMTATAETLHAFLKPTHDGHVPNTAARILTYLGAVSFVVFIPAFMVLKRYEAADRDTRR
jgi:hypothetical protein